MCCGGPWAPDDAQDADRPRAGASAAAAGIASLDRVRAFVAIRLSDELRERLAAEAERLRRWGPDVAWVAPGNLHLTLKFLGDVEAERLAAVAAAVTAAAAAVPVFHLALRGLGAFPSARRPRILWAGIGEGAEATRALAAEVDAALQPLGFPAEDRRFSPHVTLGRVRAAGAGRRLADALAAGHPSGRQPVTRVSLMGSELTSRGARHTELTAAPLAPGPDPDDRPGARG